MTCGPNASPRRKPRRRRLHSAALPRHGELGAEHLAAAFACPAALGASRLASGAAGAVGAAGAAGAVGVRDLVVRWRVAIVG